MFDPHYDRVRQNYAHLGLKLRREFNALDLEHRMSGKPRWLRGFLYFLHTFSRTHTRELSLWTHYALLFNMPEISKMSLANAEILRTAREALDEYFLSIGELRGLGNDSGILKDPTGVIVKDWDAKDLSTIAVYYPSLGRLIINNISHADKRELYNAMLYEYIIVRKLNHVLTVEKFFSMIALEVQADDIETYSVMPYGFLEEMIGEVE